MFQSASTGFAPPAAVLVCAALFGATEVGAQDRSLNLYNTNTREKLTVTFRRNGQYDREGLRELNWFLRDWRRGESIEMDPQLFDTVWEVYRQSGSSQPIHVHSGYRSKATNSGLRKKSSGVSQRSLHMSGKAIDFSLTDVPPAKVREIALKMQDGGVGYYPRSRVPFVHVDVGNVRHWPRMTRKQLASVFPDGKTLHIPSDGRPMSGYKLAHADTRKTTVASSASRSPGFLSRLFSSPRRKMPDPAPAALVEVDNRMIVAAAKEMVPLPVPRTDYVQASTSRAALAAIVGSLETNPDDAPKDLALGYAPINAILERGETEDEADASEQSAGFPMSPSERVEMAFASFPKPENRVPPDIDTWQSRQSWLSLPATSALLTEGRLRTFAQAITTKSMVAQSR